MAKNAVNYTGLIPEVGDSFESATTNTTESLDGIDIGLGVLNLNKLEKGGYDGTAQDLKNDIDAKIPIGTILYLTHNNLTGYGDYLLAQGQEVSRVTYSELFVKIGTKYGVGDGTTTFNLPNITDYIILT